MIWLFCSVQVIPQRWNKGDLSHLGQTERKSLKAALFCSETAPMPSFFLQLTAPIHHHSSCVGEVIPYGTGLRSTQWMCRGCKPLASGCVYSYCYQDTFLVLGVYPHLAA